MGKIYFIFVQCSSDNLWIFYHEDKGNACLNPLHPELRVALMAREYCNRNKMTLARFLLMFPARRQLLFTGRKNWKNFPFYDNSTNSRAFIGYFLSSISRQTHEFIIYATRQRARVDNLTVCYRKKQLDVSVPYVCPVTDNEFRHNSVKVVCGSTQLSPRGSTATLTML